ncbi:MAG TPA: maleylpyruvate isomerase N-terminal domain-containing protein [Planosporangium sp.]|jgi:uncharacterized protein (TIGR03083 family)|nr:maleylpyruvate isomerase N-terminal domain-containing protein [Planosporangium sp.]
MERNPFDLLDAEMVRLDHFYAGLADPGWREPTRCAGWDRKDLLAHLCGVEDYTRACLHDTLDDYLAEVKASGGYARYNDVVVRARADDPPDKLLAEWRAKAADNHRRLRERGPDATMTTSVGPYPLVRQSFYLACEKAIHADDAGVPVSAGERSGRLAWRATFGLQALGESAPQVRVEGGDGSYTVTLKDTSATLSEEDFVEATSGRLPADHPVPAEVRGALAVLA